MKTIAIPSLLQPPHELEELRHLVLVEARGGLVEDQHLGGDVDRPRDRDHLLDGERVAAELRRDVDVEADARERLGRAAAHGAPADAPEAARLAADGDVLRHREVGAEVDLLVDRADTGALGVERMRELHPPPVERDLAGVREVTSPANVRRRHRLRDAFGPRGDRLRGGRHRPRDGDARRTRTA